MRVVYLHLDLSPYPPIVHPSLSTPPNFPMALLSRQSYFLCYTRDRILLLCACVQSIVCFFKHVVYYANALICDAEELLCKWIQVQLS